MNLSDLPPDIYKCIIPIVSGVGRLHLYPVGSREAMSSGFRIPQHVELAQRLGLTEEEVRGCHVMKSRRGLTLQDYMGCGTVADASEEVYTKAVSKGVVILER